GRQRASGSLVTRGARGERTQCSRSETYQRQGNPAHIQNIHGRNANCDPGLNLPPSKRRSIDKSCWTLTESVARGLITVRMFLLRFDIRRSPDLQTDRGRLTDRPSTSIRRQNGKLRLKRTSECREPRSIQTVVNKTSAKREAISVPPAGCVLLLAALLIALQST